MAKKRKLLQHARGQIAASSHHGNKPPSNSTAQTTPNKQNKKKKPHHQPSQLKPVIPFAPEEAILLVGEGDLSFAASLVEHHGCANLTATVLEADLAELTGKYPHAAANVKKLEVEGVRVLYGVDARRMAPWVRKSGKKKAAGYEDPEDAAAAGTGLMDRIIFNFPHVGGKSTDVNRQVRYNQELVVDFFHHALPSLAPGGSIVVTLFDGEPYTLWNIRDLARHCDLQVERSFRFQARAYPGYHHARTLGVLRDRDTGQETGGGWRGEDRPARSYVFARKGDIPKPVPRKRKRPGEDESASSGDEEPIS